MLSAIKDRRFGGTLIEVALSLAITGLVAGGTISFFRMYTKHAEMRRTREHQEVILQALGQFLGRWGYLPCPADPAISGRNRGEARHYCSANDELAVGIVPFRSLGLSERVARDGASHFMTYAVDPALTDRHPPPTRRLFCQSYFKKPCRLKVQEGDVDCVDRFCGASGGVAVVLVSHGRGIGAFSREGKRGGGVVGEAKKRNCSGALFFCASGSGGNDIFDDLVRWETRGNLLQNFAGIKCGDCLFSEDIQVLP